MARLLVAGLLAAAALTPLVAQPAPPVVAVPNVVPMARIAPGAATLNRAEVAARVQAHFARLDANRDGVLTSNEMPFQRGQRAPAMRDPNAAFDRIDANRDGTITRDEFARGREVRVQRVVVDRRQPGQPGAMRGLHRGGGGMLGAAMLRRADLNRDGRVTLAEANGLAMQHFDMIDTNRDGRITPQERAAGRGHMRHMRSAG